MKRYYLLGFILLILFDTFGQLSFKMTALWAQPFEISIEWLVRIIKHRWFYFVVVCYSGSFLTWMILLQKVPVGPAFAASHLQVVTVMIASFFIFHESISWLDIVGALFIIVGIILLALAEDKIHQNSHK